MVDVDGRIEVDSVQKVETNADQSSIESGANSGHEEDAGDLLEELGMVEVIGGVEDDGRNEDAVEGQMTHLEGVEGRKAGDDSWSDVVAKQPNEGTNNEEDG